MGKLNAVILMVLFSVISIGRCANFKKLRCPLVWERVNSGQDIPAENAVHTMAGTHFVIREFDEDSNQFVAGWAQKVDNFTCKLV